MNKTSMLGFQVRQKNNVLILIANYIRKSNQPNHIFSQSFIILVKWLINFFFRQQVKYIKIDKNTKETKKEESQTLQKTTQQCTTRKNLEKILDLAIA